MASTRREFCAGALGAGLAGPLLGACASPGRPGDPQDAGVFAHGVASGDPLADRAVLWTRVSGAAPGPVPVEWTVARDPALRAVAARGRATARAERDYAVKVDATGLAPATTWYYQFAALGARSPVGRTRTLPERGADRLRLALASCASYPHGRFHAYRHISERPDLDLVVHLGDYLYEYANGEYGDGTPLGRVPAPDRELTTLADYRARHAQYKRDPDLQALHRAHPVVAIWDDHESANNAWRDGAENHQPESGEGDWSARRRAAVRAWFEWMPVREPGPGEGARIYRRFRFGDLAELVMLDARLVGRDRPPADADDLAAIRDPARSILGAEQEAWLAEALSRSQREGVRWRLVGQQVMFAPLRSRGGGILNPDQWDGYAASRARVLAHLREGRIDNLAVLAGDFHSSWASELPPDAEGAAAGGDPLGVEFVVPAVSAPPPLFGQPERAEQLRTDSLAANPHVRWSDWSHRGYAVLDVDRARARAEWYFLDSVRERRGVVRMAKVFETRAGTSRLREVAVPPPRPRQRRPGVY